MIERSEDAADKVGVAAKRTNFLAEFKRRNVIRMTGLYLVGAWLVTQVAATLLPAFDTPTWVMKLQVGLLSLSCFAALVFSWLYALTPERVMRKGNVALKGSIAPQTARLMGERGLQYSGQVSGGFL